MIKYKAKIFCKIHVIIIQRNALHVYIMGDDFLYLYFFFTFYFFLIAVFGCLFPKWLKEQEHSYLSLLGVLALIIIFLFLLRS